MFLYFWNEKGQLFLKYYFKLILNSTLLHYINSINNFIKHVYKSMVMQYSLQAFSKIPPAQYNFIYSHEHCYFQSQIAFDKTLTFLLIKQTRAM